MLSPHTPPGTKVTKIEHGQRINEEFGSFPVPEIGEPLTLVRIKPFNEVYPHYVLQDGIDCYLAEVRESATWISCALLRRVDLPSCLTSLLNTKKIKEDA